MAGHVQVPSVIRLPFSPRSVKYEQDLTSSEESVKHTDVCYNGIGWLKGLSRWAVSRGGYG